MTISSARRLLSSRIAGPLPGLSAQLAMAPRPRRTWKPGSFPPGARDAAGLLLVFPVDDEAHVVLTVRSAGLPSHQGQVSLPGGALERGETLEEAALRETREEIGIANVPIEILGRLTPLGIPVSGFVLHPVVAIAGERPAFRPDPREVARVLEVPIARLQARSSLRVEPWERGDGVLRRVPFFAIDGETIWGATAMVLAEFLAIVGEPPDPWGEAISG